MNELMPPRENRAPLFDSPLALVENLQRQNGRAMTTPECFSANFQVCLPYRGLFVWHVGCDDVVGDANSSGAITVFRRTRRTADPRRPAPTERS